MPIGLDVQTLVVQRQDGTCILDVQKIAAPRCGSQFVAAWKKKFNRKKDLKKKACDDNLMRFNNSSSLTIVSSFFFVFLHLGCYNRNFQPIQCDIFKGNYEYITQCRIGLVTTDTYRLIHTGISWYFDPYPQQAKQKLKNIKKTSSGIGMHK